MKRFGDRQRTAVLLYHTVVSILPFCAATAHAQTGTTVSVADFGARGDGASDDLRAFQAACNAVAAHGIVIIPPASKYYRLNMAGGSPANPKIGCLIVKNDVSVIGSGRGSRIHMDGWTVADGMANPDSGAGLQVVTAIAFGDRTHRVDGGLVRDIYVTGTWDKVTPFTGAKYSRAKGVGIYNGNDITVDSVEGYRIPGNAVNWSGNNGHCQRVKVVNSIALECAEGGFNFMGGTYEGVFSSNVAIGNGGTGFETAADDSIVSNNILTNNRDGLAFATSNNLISGNLILDNSRDGIVSMSRPACSDNVLSANLVIGSGAVGVQLAPTCVRNQLIGGVVKNSGTHGIYLAGQNSDTMIASLVVEDNRPTPTQQYGLVIASGSGVVVRGCTILGAVLGSVVATGPSTGLIIESNRVSRPISIDATASPGLIRRDNAGDGQDR